MRINIEHIVPDFLEKEKIESSAVWNKSIEILKGEKIKIVAPSGKGKSSLIHFLYGLRNDYHGNILINKRSVKNFTPADFAPLRQKELSIIFQDLRLFPDHTVYENIEIKRVLQPFHPENRITAMAERLGIGSKIGQLCKKCSYGEQQRVAIIRALQQPFDFLIMDEPFSHLDENNRKKAMELIEEEAFARNAAIILADLKDIEYFKADRILYL
jgi:putative ABC transport system ATP-binding protein